jgi:hypothetical protein
VITEMGMATSSSNIQPKQAAFIHDELFRSIDSGMFTKTYL